MKTLTATEIIEAESQFASGLYTKQPIIFVRGQGASLEAAQCLDAYGERQAREARDAAHEDRREERHGDHRRHRQNQHRHMFAV